MSMKEYPLITDFILELFKIIPDNYDIFIKEIEDFRCSLWNKSPEYQKSGYIYRDILFILENNITNIDDKLKYNIVNLYNSFIQNIKIIN